MMKELESMGEGAPRSHHRWVFFPKNDALVSDRYERYGVEALRTSGASACNGLCG